MKAEINCGVLHTCGSKLYTVLSSSAAGGVCKAAVGLLAAFCPGIARATALADGCDVGGCIERVCSVKHCDAREVDGPFCAFTFELAAAASWLTVCAAVGCTASVFGSGGARTGVSLSASFPRGLYEFKRQSSCGLW